MYAVRKTAAVAKKPYEIIHVATGQVIGHATTKEMAEATVAIRLALEGQKR